MSRETGWRNEKIGRWRNMEKRGRDQELKRMGGCVDQMIGLGRRCLRTDLTTEGTREQMRESGEDEGMKAA